MLRSDRDNKIPPFLKELEEISYRLSRQIIEITTIAGSGHPSSSLSIIDLLTVLFFSGHLQYDSANPGWPDRDRFILSKGHAAPALYVILAEAGYFNADLLPTLRQIGSPLEGHPNRLTLPGVEASTGSLGQGLSLALGHALAARVDRRTYRVWTVIGDGEADQGQIWEASMAAAKYKLDHMVLILDHNQFQQTGPISKVMPSVLPFKEKWHAFGWGVHEVDGHDLVEIDKVYKKVINQKGKPQLIVAHTLKGKGLSPFESDEATRRHGSPLKPDEEKIALEELERKHLESVEVNHVAG